MCNTAPGVTACVGIRIMAPGGFTDELAKSTAAFGMTACSLVEMDAMMAPAESKSKLGAFLSRVYPLVCRFWSGIHLPPRHSV